MTSYGPWLADALGEYLAGKTVKALLGGAYEADAVGPDTKFRSALGNYTSELNGSGYAAGGVAVTGVAVAYDSTANTVRLTCDPVDFGSPSLTAIGAIVFYVSTGDEATDVLLAFDIFQPVSSLGVPLKYTPPASGLLAASIL